MHRLFGNSDLLVRDVTDDSQHLRWGKAEVRDKSCVLFLSIYFANRHNHEHVGQDHTAEGRAEDQSDWTRCSRYRSLTDACNEPEDRTFNRLHVGNGLTPRHHSGRRERRRPRFHG